MAAATTPTTMEYPTVARLIFTVVSLRMSGDQHGDVCGRGRRWGRWAARSTGSGRVPVLITAPWDLVSSNVDVTWWERSHAVPPRRGGYSGAMPDVIVIGLGSMGSAAAYHLAARGASVIGLDRFTPPHTRGAHAGGTRIIRMTYAEGPAYVPLLRRAYALWEQLSEESGRQMVTPTGGLFVGPAASATFSGSLRSARDHGLAYDLLDAPEIRRRFPIFTP